MIVFFFASCGTKSIVFCTGRYRFSFNGKEDESWQVQDYGFRNYDPLIARFISVDPLKDKYPWYTPYQFAGNTPIWATDLDGLEPNYKSDGGEVVYGPYSPEYQNENGYHASPEEAFGHAPCEVQKAGIIWTNCPSSPEPVSNDLLASTSRDAGISQTVNPRATISIGSLPNGNIDRIQSLPDNGGILYQVPNYTMTVTAGNINGNVIGVFNIHRFTPVLNDNGQVTMNGTFAPSDNSRTNINYYNNNIWMNCVSSISMSRDQPCTQTLYPIFAAPPAPMGHLSGFVFPNPVAFNNFENLLINTVRNGASRIDVARSSTIQLNIGRVYDRTKCDPKNLPINVSPPTLR